MWCAGHQFVLVAILITGAACGSAPSQSVAGTWRFTFGKSRVYEMSLTQTGKRISGAVCVYPLSAGFPPRV